jgi:hypothetical protein
MKNERRDFMRGKILFGLIPLSLFLLILWGCAMPMSYQQGEGATGEIPLSEMLRFNDIPVPGTFRFDSQNSYIFEDKLTRIGVLKYTTATSPDEVVMFFKREMPNAGWQLINILEYGQKILTYDKGEESCVINILPGRTQSTVMISVTPKSSGGGYSGYEEEYQQGEGYQGEE